jgi:fructoselysine-6-P-deglycase FrlB-like protein
MSEQIRSTGIWQDVAEMPASLQATLDAAIGFAEVVDLLKRTDIRRIVASGNGASYYVAQAFWLAALEGDHDDVEVVAVPGGLIAKGLFRWRTGDALLAVSSSGEFRDIVEAIEHTRFQQPVAAVTATPDSTIADTATARAVVHIGPQRAVTHTQAFCGAVTACLAIWAEVADDRMLSLAVSDVPEVCERSLAMTERWVGESLMEMPTPSAAIAFGTGPAWAAALEDALLVKEIARVPCEGAETREAATAGMTALRPDHLALSLPIRDDPLIREAEEICRRRGAYVLRAPGGAEADRRLAAIATFPAALALSVELALRAGLDTDNPEWIETYYTTARRSS